MNSGSLNRIVCFQAPTHQRDTTGQRVKGFCDIKTRAKTWAQVIELRGNEKWEAEQKRPGIHKRLKVHYRNDIDETLTVVVDGKRYDITAIRELHNRSGIMIDIHYLAGRYTAEIPHD
jgi:SPP1 family predicted phage head-tail adaptor